MQDLTPVGLSEDGTTPRPGQLLGRGVRRSRGHPAACSTAWRERTTRPVGDEDGQRTAPPRHPGAHPRGRVPRGRRGRRADHGRGDHAVRRPGARRARPRRPDRPEGLAPAPVRRGRPARPAPSARPPSCYFAEHSLHDEDVEWDAWRRAGRPLGPGRDVRRRGQRPHRRVHPRPARPLRRRRERRRAGPHRRAARPPASAGRRHPRGRRRAGSARCRPRTSCRSATTPSSWCATGPRAPSEPTPEVRVEPPPRRPARRDRRRGLDRRRPRPPPTTCPCPWPRPRAGDEPPSDEPDEPAGPPRTRTTGRRSRPSQRKGRSSVPSWDEIMFGGGKDE